MHFGVDRDEITVGRFEGYFNGLQIRMKRGSINMLKMVVHFGNGEAKEVSLKNSFNEGDHSRIIELPGNIRMIASVVFWYETKDFEGKTAIVELWGRH